MKSKTSTFSVIIATPIIFAGIACAYLAHWFSVGREFYWHWNKV